MKRVLAAIAVFLLAILPVQAERLVSEISNDTVEITSSFDGERLSFFGTIAPDAGSTDKVVTGPFHVIIVILGPTQNRVARQMTHNFGIWLRSSSTISRAISTYCRAVG
jgi:hypothetical protein